MILGDSLANAAKGGKHFGIFHSQPQMTTNLTISKDIQADRKKTTQGELLDFNTLFT